MNGVGMAAGWGDGHAADGADMLLELRNGAGVDGPVTGIMGARGDLIGEQAAVAQDEHLQRQHADKVDGTGQMFRHAARFCKSVIGDRGGDGGFCQDVMAVLVEDGAVNRGLAELVTGDDA
jgi:hypothetical protein